MAEPATAFRTRAPAQRRLPEPFHWDGLHIAGALPGGRVLFTTRRGGVSGGSFSSLNLSATVGDDERSVAANRQRLAARCGLTWEQVCHGHQVHGAVVRRAAEPPSGARPPADEDGQVAVRHDVAALVLAADCLPVMLVCRGAVAALHGGWRGLAAGVLEEGMAALRESGGMGPVAAALGPCARGCCYEVGEDVQGHFGEPGARRGARGLELAAIARARLQTAGVEEVHDVGLCTMCVPELFFSHRRERGVTGRQAGLAWRA